MSGLRVAGDVARKAATLPTRTVDVAVAAGLTIVGVASVLPYWSQLHPVGLAVVLVALQGVPLAARRSHPVATFLAVGSARLAYDLVGIGWAPLPLAAGIAVFTVADRCAAPARRLVGALLVGGVLSSELASPHHHQPYDLSVAALFFAASWVTGVANRARHARTEEVELRAQRAVRDLDLEGERAAARERARIARELHDVVAHHVSLIAVQAEAAGSLLPGRPEAAAGSIEIIGSTARQALVELRSLLGVLRSPTEPLETAPSASVAELDGVIRQVRSAGVAVALAVTGTPRRLSPTVDLTAFRIVQEALTNTVRHAPGSEVRVTLGYEPDAISVTVTDVGDRGGVARGADLPVGDGFGLTGIAERVASCGGRISAGPTREGGFAVVAELPTP